MKILDLLEMPVKDYKTFGDFTKNRSFADQKDRIMTTHPSAVKHLTKKLVNSSCDWHFYFVNEPGLRKYSETGKVDLEFVKNNLKNKELYNYIVNQDLSDAITVIFVSNTGDEKVPFTNWIKMHRVMHALARGNREYYTRISNHIIRSLSEILENYNKSGYSTSQASLFFGDKRDQERKIFKAFFQQVCTFKSARENNIREWFEVINELGAQYLITGHVKFKEAPFNFKYDRNRFLSTDKIGQESTSNTLEILARDIEFLLEDLFSTSIGDIYVM